MAITFPLSFPYTVGLLELNLRLRYAISRTESEFSFVEQIVEHDGQMWVLEIDFGRVTNRSDVEDMLNFIFSLQGKKGTFLFGDPASTKRGSWAGTPLVDGSGQSGNSLNLKGFTINSTNVVSRGDFFQLGSGGSSKLHKVVGVNKNSDGAGKTTIDFVPKLRSSPADNAPIVFNNPQGLFRLSDNENGYNLKPWADYSTKVMALESLTGV